MSAARRTARAASTVPYPAPPADLAGSGGRAVPPAAAPPGAAAVLPASARVTWATVSCGYLDTIRAATPATMPLDMHVVLIGA